MVEITYLHSVPILSDILQRCGHSLLGKTALRTKGHKHQVEKTQYLEEKICVVKISCCELIGQKNLIFPGFSVGSE